MFYERIAEIQIAMFILQKAYKMCITCNYMNVYIYIYMHMCIYFFCINIYAFYIYMCRLPWWFSDKDSACHCLRCGFDPWVGKIPWRRKWQPTPVFLPGESHGQRSLGGYSPWGRKESDMNQPSTHAPSP